MRRILGGARRSGLLVALGCLLGAVSGATAAPAPLGPMAFVNHRDPPPYLPLPKALAAQYSLGHAVFNTDFLAVGTPGAGRRSGLGPLFNSASCDECHNEGAHGRGPEFDGPLPNSMVVQLESVADGASPFDPSDPPGDPVYGHVISPGAIEGYAAEAVPVVQYHIIQRSYPDGSLWTLRQPTYTLMRLNYGPLAPNVLLKPRLAPALFGLGILESVMGRPGRFGWQGAALNIRDQTTRALAREMGVTSTDRPVDDCTATQVQCLQQRHPQSPEMSGELLDALLTFEKWLSVPENPSPADPAAQAKGMTLFISTGCSGCHRPQQQVRLDHDGTALPASIAPFSDLLVHDLGAGLADRDAAGTVHPTRFRTAPLWGMGYRIAREHKPMFLHDGRARSVEEAVLWHDGEAAAARNRFEHLSREQREQLLRFVAAL